MSTHQATVGVTLVAAGALSVGQCVEVNSSGQASLVNATTDVVAGVAGETVSAGDAVTVNQLTGIIECIAGGTITAGQLVVPAATLGRVTGVASIAALAAGTMAIGTALDGAAAGEVFRVLAKPLTATL